MPEFRSTPAEKNIFVVQAYGGDYTDVQGVFTDRDKAASFASRASRRGVFMKVIAFKTNELPILWEEGT